MWCVAELDEEYIRRMEDILAVYEKPRSEREPDHEQDVSDCTSGTTSCDPSRLTESEARDRLLGIDRVLGISETLDSTAA